MANKKIETKSGADVNEELLELLFKKDEIFKDLSATVEMTTKAKKTS